MHPQRIIILNHITVAAAKKIWQFYKYQKLVNDKLNDLICEVNPKIKTVLQVKQKKHEMGLETREFHQLCTKALENKANLLKPLLLLNARNSKSHLEYFTDILQIIHYSSGDKQHCFVSNCMLNQERKKESKQIFKVIKISFNLLEGDLTELTRCLILICIDSILKVLMECAKINTLIIDDLKQFSTFSRSIAYKQQYEGINQFLQLIGSFKSQLKDGMSDLQITNTLHNLMQQLECPICQMFFTIPVSMQCGHSFCRACITSDQLQLKKCPMCRAEQTENINLVEENQFLTKLIGKIELHKAQAKVTEEISFLDQGSQEIIHHYQQLLVLRSKNSIQLFLEQCVEIDCKKFSTISNQQLQQILLKYPIFIAIDQNQNLSYLVENKMTKMIGKRLFIMIDCIAKISITEFLDEEILFNQQAENLIFYYQIANASTAQDQSINIEDSVVVENIKKHITAIKGQFNQLLQTRNNDQTYQILYSYLQKCGFLGLNNSDLDSNYEQLKKYTYLLSSIVRFKEHEQQQIIKTDNILSRLEQLETYLQRFKYCVSPLMVFKINQPKMYEQRNWKKYLFILFIIVVFQLIEF